MKSSYDALRVIGRAYSEVKKMEEKRKMGLSILETMRNEHYGRTFTDELPRIATTPHEPLTEEKLENWRRAAEIWARS